MHPKYLDTKGLVALWREALLAKHVLEDKTKGYKNHPQLHRFKKAASPIDAIDQYLSEVYFEASRRQFNFDKQKINWSFKKQKLPVTTGQLNYEVEHLLNKLKNRDIEKYKELRTVSEFQLHPIFKLIAGNIEAWEILPGANKI